MANKQVVGMLTLLVFVFPCVTWGESALPYLLNDAYFDSNEHQEYKPLLDEYLNGDSEKERADYLDDSMLNGEPKRLLPIWGDKAMDTGHKLPLPYGAGCTFYYVERDVDVKEVSVGLGANGPMRPVEDYLEFDVRTYVRNYSVKFDAWLFPFMNVYALAGYMENKSRIDMRVTVDGTDYAINTYGNFNGATYGVGTVLAGGYANYFMTFDYTYVFSEMDDFDTDFKGSVAGLKMGWKGPIRQYDTRIWVGGTFWDTEREMAGSVGNVLRFKILQAPEDRFNYNVGGNVELNDHFNLLFDYGTDFSDTTTLLFSGGLRW